jgi:hypothetical protein
MKSLVAVLIVVCASPCVVIGAENSLELWAKDYQVSSAPGHPDVCVSAYAKRVAGRHMLAFRLTNHSRANLTFDDYDLPWAFPYAIRITVVTSDGKRVPNVYPIADKPIERQKVILRPGESLEGDYDLEHVVDFAWAPKNKDLIVLWCYPVPSSSAERAPVCTGAAVIPKTKNQK